MVPHLLWHGASVLCHIRRTVPILKSFMASKEYWGTILNPDLQGIGLWLIDWFFLSNRQYFSHLKAGWSLSCQTYCNTDPYFGLFQRTLRLVISCDKQLLLLMLYSNPDFHRIAILWIRTFLIEVLYNYTLLREHYSNSKDLAYIFPVRFIRT